MTINRREFVSAMMATPLLSLRRERRIGYGRHPVTGELIHETIQPEEWDGREWQPAGRSRTRMYRDGQVVREFEEPLSIEEIAARRAASGP